MRLLAPLLGLQSIGAAQALLYKSSPDETCAGSACRAERAATSLLLKYQTTTSGEDDEIGLFGSTLPWIEVSHWSLKRRGGLGVSVSLVSRSHHASHVIAMVGQRHRDRLRLRDSGRRAASIRPEAAIARRDHARPRVQHDRRPRGALQHGELPHAFLRQF